ncbi:hypothetical protein QJQ45_011334 [Haematococcus lacustris]|nr:hypothetical protein QJQ45_011334 [Haematococcus lacustris]
MQRIGESRWRPLELCFWPDQAALPAKGKEYPGLGYKRAPLPPNEDADNPLYKQDDFRMFALKSVRSALLDTEKAKRRDPRLHQYTGVACPEMKKSMTCPRGDSCTFSHNVFEYWLHPSRYRTQLCNDGIGCNRKVCFFAHTLDELRVSSVKVLNLTGDAAKLVGMEAGAVDPFSGGPDHDFPLSPPGRELWQDRPSAVMDSSNPPAPGLSLEDLAQLAHLQNKLRAANNAGLLCCGADTARPGNHHGGLHEEVAAAIANMQHQQANRQQQPDLVQIMSQLMLGKEQQQQQQLPEHAQYLAAAAAYAQQAQVQVHQELSALQLLSHIQASSGSPSLVEQYESALALLLGTDSLPEEPQHHHLPHYPPPSPSEQQAVCSSRYMDAGMGPPSNVWVPGQQHSTTAPAPHLYPQVSHQQYRPGQLDQQQQQQQYGRDRQVCGPASPSYAFNPRFTVHRHPGHPPRPWGSQGSPPPSALSAAVSRARTQPQPYQPAAPGALQQPDRAHAQGMLSLSQQAPGARFPGPSAQPGGYHAPEPGRRTLQEQGWQQHDRSVAAPLAGDASAFMHADMHGAHRMSSGHCGQAGWHGDLSASTAMELGMVQQQQQHSACMTTHTFQPAAPIGPAAPGVRPGSCISLGAPLPARTEQPRGWMTAPQSLPATGLLPGPVQPLVAKACAAAGPVGAGAYHQMPSAFKGVSSLRSPSPIGEGVLGTTGTTATSTSLLSHSHSPTYSDSEDSTLGLGGLQPAAAYQREGKGALATAAAFGEGRQVVSPTAGQA